MAPKKKKGTGTKKKKATPVLPPFEFVSPTVVELGAKPSEFVRVKICGPALPHLNFEWPAVPTEITLGLIKDAIAKRHSGSMPRMALYKDQVGPGHEIASDDDSVSLKDLGIAGVVPGAGGSDGTLPLLQLYYDYTAPGAGDPVVCVEPDPVESRYDVSLKAYMREQKRDRERSGVGTAVH